MALSYTKDIKPLEDAGKTDAEIADQLSKITAKPISCVKLRRYSA